MVEFFRPFTSPSPPDMHSFSYHKRKLISANEKPVLASITSSEVTGTVVECHASPSQIWRPHNDGGVEGGDQRVV
jgi:hypothetical protein